MPVWQPAYIGLGSNLSDPAAQVRAVRVLQQLHRGKLNADLSVAELREYCALDRDGKKLLAQARGRLGLTARGVHRVLRVLDPSMAAVKA